MAFENLLSPMNIGTLTVKNRTVMTAAESRSDGWPPDRAFDGLL